MLPGPTPASAFTKKIWRQPHQRPGHLTADCLPLRWWRAIRGSSRPLALPAAAAGGSIFWRPTRGGKAGSTRKVRRVSLRGKIRRARAGVGWFQGLRLILTPLREGRSCLDNCGSTQWYGREDGALTVGYAPLFALLRFFFFSIVLTYIITYQPSSPNQPHPPLSFPLFPFHKSSYSPPSSSSSSSSPCPFRLRSASLCR